LEGILKDSAEILTDSVFDFANFFVEALSSLLFTILTGEVYTTYFYASFLGVFGASTGFDTGFTADFAGVAISFAFEGVATV
jgi:hypothetical protein